MMLITRRFHFQVVNPLQTVLAPDFSMPCKSERRAVAAGGLCFCLPAPGQFVSLTQGFCICLIEVFRDDCAEYPAGFPAPGRAVLP